MDNQNISVVKDNKGRRIFVFEDAEHKQNLLENLNMLRKNRKFCDVILQVGTNQDVHEIYAHKVVLSSSSPYFLEMFSTNESVGNGSNTNIPQQYRLIYNNAGSGSKHANGGGAVMEFDPEAFASIIDYAYTARLEVYEEKIREIYAIATRLKMSNVAYKCGLFLLSTLTPENCIEVRNMKAVWRDPYLLQSVDGYIRQNFEKIIASTALESRLPHVKVDFLLGSEQEEQNVNDRHVFNEILEWIHSSVDREALNIDSLKENQGLMLMLYYNKERNEIQDCREIEDVPITAEEIEDYKKLAKRQSLLAKTLSNDNIPNGNNNINVNGKLSKQAGNQPQQPSKSRQFLFTRSDSESSLSSVADDDEMKDFDWKVLANCRVERSSHTLIGLVTITGRLCLLSISLRIKDILSTNGSQSKKNSRGEADLINNDYCLIPPMSSPRCAVGTAELDGKLFVCGGYDRGECLKTVEVYDLKTNRWEMLQQMQIPRGRFAITVVNGNVYAIGGCDGQNELNSAEFYDSLTADWKLIQSAPVVRSNAGVCNMDSKIYVIGGWNGNRGLTRCDIFDPKVGVWSEISSLNVGRYQTGVCVLEDIIYAVGGCDSWSCLNSVEAYCQDAWRLVAPLQTARRGCGVATYNGKIYVVGGHDGVHALCSIEIYDPAEDQWIFGQPMTTPRANVGVAVVGNRLYAVGGFNGKTFLNSIEYFDFENNEWTTSVAVTKIKNDSEQQGTTLEQLNNKSNGVSSIKEQKRNNKIGNNNNNDKNNNNSNNNINNEFKTAKEATILALSTPTTTILLKTKNSLSSEPLVEVEESLIGH